MSHAFEGADKKRPGEERRGRVQEAPPACTAVKVEVKAERDEIGAEGTTAMEVEERKTEANEAQELLSLTESPTEEMIAAVVQPSGATTTTKIEEKGGGGRVQPPAVPTPPIQSPVPLGEQLEGGGEGDESEGKENGRRESGAMYRLRMLPLAREWDAPPHSGAGSKKRPREASGRQLAMLSWAWAEAGEGLSGIRGGENPPAPGIAPPAGTSAAVTGPQTPSARDIARPHGVRVLLERQLGTGGPFGRSSFRASTCRGPSSSEPVQTTPSALSAKGAGKSMEVVEDKPDEECLLAKSRKNENEGPGECEKRRSTAEEGVTDVEASWRKYVPKREANLRARHEGTGVLRPASVSRPGQRWDATCRGWRSLRQQWEAPAVVMSRASARSWQKTWGAYTSNFAATPTAARDQGVQKVLDVRFDPSGEARLVCGCNAGPNELLLYELDTGKVRELPGHGCQIQVVEFADNGALIVSVGGHLLKVWDAATATCMHTLGPDVTPAPVRATASTTPAPAPPEIPPTVPGHRKKISAVTVNRWQPAMVASSGGHGDLRLLVWDVQKGRLLCDLNAQRRAEGADPKHSMDAMAFGTESTLVCGSDGFESETSVVQIWDVGNGGQLVRNVPMHQKFITSLHVDSKCSATVITGSGDGSVGLLDLRTARPIGRLPVGPLCEVTSVSMSSCSRFLQASSTANCTLVWDTRMLDLSLLPVPASDGTCSDPLQAAQPPAIWSASAQSSRALHTLSHGRPMPTIENAGQLPGYVDEGDEGVNDARWMHRSSTCLVTGSGNGSWVERAAVWRFGT
eukprot:TRINITY_DN3743_c0_g2_i2.p1 TRINITY_DN3743_c0_g2~~TRINITY_DN3743_c0_g2_i2.p1  ORF type:complete len:845 (-),score=168.58 TRINITY_DN3743_c0_g2_i2:893-3292(-)